MKTIKDMSIINVCADCAGPYTSPYDKGKCLICGCLKAKLCDIAYDLLDSEYIFMKKIEGQLGQDFWEIIKTYNREGIILRKKNMIGFTSALRWLKHGYGLNSIRMDHTMANICIKDGTPIPREDAYHLFREGYNGLKETHWTRYIAKQAQ